MVDGHQLLDEILPAEFGNILWKKTRHGEIGVPKAVEILRALADVPLQLSASFVLLEAAYLIAERFQRTVYDSLYLSLAVLAECPMVTADRKL